MSLSPRALNKAKLGIKLEEETKVNQNDVLQINSHYFLPPAEQINFNVIQIEKQLQQVEAC